MKTFLITGGARGIGRSIAENLLQHDDVSLVIIDKENSQFIDRSVAEYGDRFKFYLQDIADRLALDNVLQEIGTYPIHGIVNNAGEVYLEKWDGLQLSTWDRTLAVNLTAPLHIVHMLRRNIVPGGVVVNIASTDAYSAAYDTIAYAASKAALINLTQSLAVVLGGQGVRVNAVAPGWVETEMTAGTLPAEASELTPLGRNTTSDDVAKVVCFLLADEARFVNGQTITVDGGLSVVDYTLKREADILQPE